MCLLGSYGIRIPALDTIGADCLDYEIENTNQTIARDVFSCLLFRSRDFGSMKDSGGVIRYFILHSSYFTSRNRHCIQHRLHNSIS